MLQAIDDLKVAEENKARVVVEEYVPPQQAKKSFPPEPYVMIPGIARTIQRPNDLVRSSRPT